MSCVLLVMCNNLTQRFSTNASGLKTENVRQSSQSGFASVNVNSDGRKQKMIYILKLLEISR